jgi:hypothetical protein
MKRNSETGGSHSDQRNAGKIFNLSHTRKTIKGRGEQIPESVGTSGSNIVKSGGNLWECFAATKVKQKNKQVGRGRSGSRIREILTPFQNVHLFWKPSHQVSWRDCSKWFSLQSENYITRKIYFLLVLKPLVTVVNFRKQYIFTKST